MESNRAIVKATTTRPFEKPRRSGHPEIQIQRLCHPPQLDSFCSTRPGWDNFFNALQLEGVARQSVDVRISFCVAHGKHDRSHESNFFPGLWGRRNRPLALSSLNWRPQVYFHCLSLTKGN